MSAVGLQALSVEFVYTTDTPDPVNTLQGITVEPLTFGAIAYVTDADLEFRWYPDSLDAPALNSVVVPDGQSLLIPGRWKIVTGGGSQGPQGPQGAQGAQGAQGPGVGAQGPTGPQGTQGVQGVQGSAGAQGAQGAAGAQGAQGAQGAVGAQGTQGVQGAQGSAGAQGAQGSTGAQGTQGVQGAQGTAGAQGAQGAAGAQGAQGAQGPQGTQGATGPDWDGTEFSLGTVSGTTDLPFNTYRNVYAEITGNTDFTFNAGAAAGHYQVRLLISGAFTVDLPVGTLYPSGAAYTPSGSGSTDILNLFKDGAGVWYVMYTNDWTT